MSYYSNITYLFLRRNVSIKQHIFNAFNPNIAKEIIEKKLFITSIIYDFDEGCNVYRYIDRDIITLLELRVRLETEGDKFFKNVHNIIKELDHPEGIELQYYPNVEEKEVELFQGLDRIKFVALSVNEVKSLVKLIDNLINNKIINNQNDSL